MPQEHLADRGPRRRRVELADAGQHVAAVATAVTPRPVSGPHRVVAAVGVAGHHHRHPQPGRGQPPGVVRQHLGVAAVGAADQQHHVRAGGPQRGRAPARSSRPAATCTTRAPADSPTRCPASAVTSARSPPPPAAARRRPTSRRRSARSRTACAAPRPRRPRRRPGRRSTSVSTVVGCSAVATSVAGVQVDDGRLGEGRTDVGADRDQAARGARPGDGAAGTTTVPVAVTATIGGSSTSAADSRPVRPAAADDQALEVDRPAAGADPGHRRPDLEHVAGPDRGPELNVRVGREQALVAVGADAHLGGHIAEQRRARTRRRPGCRRSGRASTARTAGAPPSARPGVHRSSGFGCGVAPARAPDSSPPRAAWCRGRRCGPRRAPRWPARRSAGRRRPAAAAARPGTPPGTRPTSPGCCAGARRAGSRPGSPAPRRPSRPGPARPAPARSPGRRGSPP